MLADTKRAFALALGILHEQEGVALRATFIVDPLGVQSGREDALRPGAMLSDAHADSGRQL